MLRKLVVAAMVVSMVAVAFLGLPNTVQAQEAPFGPWVDEVIFSQNDDTSVVLTQVINGDEDTLLFTVLGASNKLRAVQAPEIQTIHTFGSYSGYVMNPMEQASGVGFNPFTIAEVREGVQWLIDRDLIAREIYSGFATPWIAPYHPVSADYGRFAPDMILLEDAYAYNPTRGQQQITEALTAAGASQNAQGMWIAPDGNPIEITIWMRIEDDRLQEGNYLADILEGVGFTVDRQPIDRTFISQVYGGAPDQGRWHIYTEGWISTAQILYDDFQLFDFYGCYWEVWCEDVTPGGFSQDQALYDAYLALAEGEYATFDERNQLIRSVLPDTLPNAYRAWTVAEESVYPLNNRVSAAYDLFGGPVHELFGRTARINDAPGGSLRVVNLLGGQDAWNPHIFVETLYDADIRDYYRDFAMIRHPHLGRLIDMRVNTAVETEGPDGTLAVPSTAEMFDADTNAWVAVGSGVEATSKVTVDYIWGDWHHNETMSMDDVRTNIALFVRRAFGDISEVQPNAASAGAKSFWPRFKGFNFVDGDTLEFYVDFFHLDPTEIAGTALDGRSIGWPQVPWEVNELMARTALDNETAFAESDAENIGLPWMDLTKGDSIPFLEGDLASLSMANAKPPGSSAYISDAEATARWAALNDWYDAQGHFWPSNGPFVLEGPLTDTQLAAWSFTLTAFRDGYPLRADHWEQYRVPAIPDISMRAPPSTVFSGQVASFDFTSTVAGFPYDDITSNWFLKDLSTGEFVEQGTATRTGAGAYSVQLSAQLTEELLFGNFQLILVVSTEAAAPPSIERVSFLILPSTDWFQGLLSATESALRSDIDALESQQQSLTDSLNAQTAATQGLLALVTALTILSVVAIAVAVVSVVLVLRRVPKSPGG